MIDWNKRNGGFLSPEIVYENQLNDLSYQIDEKNKEIERLNNIINDLGNYLNEQVDYMTHHSIERMVAFDCCRHKLQELKGDSND